MMTVDTTQWPLVHQRIEGRTDATSFDAFIRDITEVIERHEVHGIVCETTPLTWLDGAQRLRIAEWMRHREEKLREHLAGVAFVIEADAVRYILASILWTQRLPVPYTVTDSVESAREWLAEALAARGVDTRVA